MEEQLKQLQAAIATAIEQVKALVVEKGKTESEVSALRLQQTNLEAQLKSIEAGMDRLKAASERPNVVPFARIKSPGEIFVESAGFKEMQGRKSRSCAPADLEHGFHFYAAMRQQKDLSSALQNNTGVGAELVPAFRVPGVVQPPFRKPRIRDLLPSIPTQSNTIQFVQETNFNQLYSQLTAQATKGQADLVVDNTYGFYDGQTVVIAQGTVAEETKVIDTGGVDHDNLTLTLSTNLSNTHAINVSVVSDTFVFTAETQLKPKASITFEEVNESVKTLAHWLPATRQMLDDASQIRAMIDGRLVEGLVLNEERQFLYGDGSADQLQGILSHASVQTYAWSSGTAGDEKIDAIRRAMTLAALAHYPVDGVVVHPTDWTDIELVKGDDGHYLMAPVMNGNQSMMLWRAPIVETTAIDVGDFCVGAWSLGAAVYDREQSSIRISESHEDFFVRNMVVVLAEERIALVIYRPDSFVYGTFDSAPGA